MKDHLTPNRGLKGHVQDHLTHELAKACHVKDHLTPNRGLTGHAQDHLTPNRGLTGHAQDHLTILQWSAGMTAASRRRERSEAVQKRSLFPWMASSCLLAKTRSVRGGEAQLNGHEGQKVLDLRELSNGVYTITILCGEYYQTEKLVVTK